MGFLVAIRSCLLGYVKFSGRAARREYWWFALFLLLAGIATGMIDTAIYGEELIRKDIIDEETYATYRTTGPFASAFWLMTCLPFLAVGWRRMHDTGRSGIYLLSPLIVMVGAILVFDALGRLSLPMFLVAAVVSLISSLVVVWWLTRPSEPGPNRYGPNPQEVTP